MVRKVYESRIEAPVEKVWAFHSSAEALKILTPPWQEVRLVSTDNTVREGALHVLETRKFGLKLLWKARISEVTPPSGFRDTAEKSPFKRWTHRHDFLDEEGMTILRDTVEYEPPGWIFGGMLNALFIEEDIDKLFKYRHQMTKQFLETTPLVLNPDLIGQEGAEYRGLADEP